MEEISNKTIAILIVTAIIISVGVTYINLSRISRVFVPTTTGALSSGSGNVSFSVIEEEGIEVIGNINFGAGRINDLNVSATLNSSLTNALSSNGTWDWGRAQSIMVRNTGTTNLSINFSASPAPAIFFIGGTNPSAKIWTNYTTAGSSLCIGSSAVEIQNTSQMLCEKLVRTAYVNSSVNVSAFIYLYSDVSGSKTTVVTFAGVRNST